MTVVASSLSAADVIEMLDLGPHPEGGYYRETFRDAHVVEGRAASTAIYFLLTAGSISHWHRVDAAEVWHWYAGDALEIRFGKTVDESVCQQLGPDIATGARPQIVVPANHWQSAQSLGAWTLVGCTVAPGFTFAGFELAPPGCDPAGS